MPKPDPSKDTTGAAAPFDFDAFIAGTKLPRDEVPLRRVDNSVRIAQLTAQIEAAKKEPGDQRESDTGTSDLETEREALQAEQDSSVTWFELRALSANEFAELANDDDKDLLDQLAAQSKGTRNELSREQWETIRGSVHPGTWGDFVGRANTLVGSKAPMPDFSRSASRTSSPPESSAS